MKLVVLLGLLATATTAACETAVLDTEARRQEEVKKAEEARRDAEQRMLEARDEAERRARQLQQLQAALEENLRQAAETDAEMAEAAARKDEPGRAQLERRRARLQSQRAELQAKIDSVRTGRRVAPPPAAPLPPGPATSVDPH